jgi:hypothetical protein
VALGAEPADVRRLVLNQGSRLVLTGVRDWIGLDDYRDDGRCGGVIVMVSTVDPLTFVGVTAVLAFSALAACYLPARPRDESRAVAVLRQE